MKFSKKAIHQRNCLISDLMDKCLLYSTRNETTQTGLVNEFLELNSIATNIRSIEAGLFVPHQREDHLENFVSWLESNGCSHENIEIFCVNEATKEYGLRAKKDIEEDESTLTIPKNLMMTSETASLDPILATIATEDTLLKSMSNVMLAFRLMVEHCREDSFWKPYILFCPSSYATPLYYTKDDIQLLKGSPSLLDAVKLTRNIYRQYAYFWKKLSTKNSAFSKLETLKSVYCLDLYCWAASTVMSRQNQIPSLPSSEPDTLPSTSSSTPAPKQPANLTALIPLWDMCNHSDGKFSTDYDPNQSKLFCYAMKPYTINEQFTIFYGRRTNAEFLVNNGFVPENNPYDFVAIRLGLSQVDPLYELRSRLCSKMGLLPSGHFALHHRTIGLDENLLNFVKIFLMDKMTLERLLDSNLSVNNLFDDLPSDLCQHALNFISIRCQLLLKSYTNPETKENLSFCSQQIIQLTEIEKDILSSHVIKRTTTTPTEPTTTVSTPAVPTATVSADTTSTTPATLEESN